MILNMSGPRAGKVEVNNDKFTNHGYLPMSIGRREPVIREGSLINL